MTSVNVAALKNQLSRYLGLVREGQEVVIRDRNRPIAKIVPLSSIDDADTEEQGLIAAGKLRPGAGPLRPSFFRLPAPRVPPATVLAALEAERNER